MSPSVWPSSPLDAAEGAFVVLTRAPTVLVLNGGAFPGLPERAVALDELRRVLLASATAVECRDAVWRELVVRSRRDGPAWVVAAVGMAMPGLRRAAGRLATGCRGDTADLDAELVAGFIERLGTIDLERGRICGRLIDAGLRAARRVRQTPGDLGLVRGGWVGSRVPVAPWDHPDLVLARAVVVAVLDPEEAHLIGTTRLGHASLAQVAAELGIDAGLAGTWRRRAERRLAEAIRAGELDHVVITRRPRRRRRSAAGPVGSLLGS